ncbi:type IV secretory system conjugative DNA transfer family protein [Rhizobium ruizarguesonis]
MYPREEHPAMWVDLPDDLRRGWLWDGQLPDGREAANLCFQYIKEPDLIALGEKAGRQALKLTAFLAAGVSLLAFPQFLPVIDALPAFPSWALDSSAYGALGAWALQTAAMLVWATATLVISNGWPLLLLLPVFAWFAFLEGMKTLWNSVSYNMRRPTMDALVADFNGTRRDEQYEAYNDLVADTADRLGEYPVIPLGVSTGAMAAAGVAGAPSKGTLLSIDGHSVMRHMIVFGRTGTGKTRLVLQPLFRRLVIDAVWPEGHKAGAYVTDGKGVLWQELLAFCGRRRSEVKIIGTEEGHYGVDLVAGMSPPQIAEALLAVGAQMGGSGSGKDKFWVDKAVAIIKRTAWIALAIDSDEEVRQAFIEVEDCRPYSLLGIYKLAIDDAMARKAIGVVKDLANCNDDKKKPELGKLYRKAVREGTWLHINYLDLKAESTKDGFKSNVESLLSLIEDDEQLSERFCTGIFDKDRTMGIDYCLEGGITMLAIGAGTGEGEFGQFIAIWLKTKLMQTARARNAKNPKIADKFSCAMFADEYQMLATTGTTNSCEKFWAVGRSSGLYLIAASQSIAALESSVGQKPAHVILSNMSTRILLSTNELGTLEYYTKLLGKSMQVISSLKGVFSNHAEIIRKFGRPTPALAIGGLAGVMPTRFAAPTETLPVYDISHLLKLNEELPPEKQESRATIEKRQEDMISAAKKEAQQWKDKIDIDRLTTGQGYALVIAERGAGTRTDFVNLKPLLNV